MDPIDKIMVNPSGYIFARKIFAKKYLFGGEGSTGV
jgi:hypothetical protein